MMEHGELMTAVEPIVREAGELILSYYGKTEPQIKGKGSGISLVTKADVASEKFLMKKLGELVPEASFLAEESGKSGTSECSWVIDPLDGTSNFSYQIPHFCISVAMTMNDEPVLGVVYQPLTREYYAAARGKGAWLNGKQLKLPPADGREKELLMMCFPYGHSRYLNQLITNIQQGERSYSVRLLGSAALDLVYLAVGRIDGVFLHEMFWWDVAAGMLIIEEAGGRVTDFEGKALSPDFKTLVAASPQIHERLLKIAAVTQ